MWRYFNIRPQYKVGAHRELSRSFYAPDLETAFMLARATWPGAIGWECTS